MDVVYATATTHVTTREGARIVVHKGQHWPADDPVVKAMGKQFAKVGPREGGEFFAWLLDGGDPAAHAAARSTVPGPVLGILKNVFGRGYTRNVAPVWR